ncbi:uncharacterized protein BJX67DRAFT_367749 [Aspergillus lucknowensis]|uniref:Uncharacterized protein n=1 Tax=Aspergillus lucknowensis TaxID=176173 RepID=A0ABR4L9Q0_9EURO
MNTRKGKEGRGPAGISHYEAGQCPDPRTPGPRAVGKVKQLPAEPTSDIQAQVIN